MHASNGLFWVSLVFPLRQCLDRAFAALLVRGLFVCQCVSLSGTLQSRLQYAALLAVHLVVLCASEDRTTSIGYISE